MEADLVVKGGTICTTRGFYKGSIACAGGKIVAIGEESSLPKANVTLNADKKIVIPGIIDTHVHFRDPGYTYKEDFQTGSTAAAAGGVTMVVDMPNTAPLANTAEKFSEHIRNAGTKSLVDFNTWALPTVREEIPKIAALGAVGFKFFMKVWHYPYGTETAICSNADILETFRMISKTGLPCLVHPHDGLIWEHNAQKWTEAGKTDFEGYREAQWADEDIIKTVPAASLVLIANAVNAKLRLLHINEAPYIKLARALKQGGYQFMGEMNPWAIFCPPGWPERKDMCGSAAEQWAALNDGTIDLIATDHAPHTKEEFDKTKTDAFNSVGGVIPYVEHYLSLFLTEVNRGKISLERLVALCSENVAKHLNVYPQKGAIQIGSDADLTIVDMELEDTIRSGKMFSKAGWTPFEGVKVKGVPIHTILRGKIICQDRQPVGTPGYGKFIPPLKSAY